MKQFNFIKRVVWFMKTLHRKTINCIPFTTEYQKKSQSTVPIPISPFTKFKTGILTDEPPVIKGCCGKVILPSCIIKKHSHLWVFFD